MYSTCLFCNSSLGANETIEAFPVGRRLAFDAAKGRLWVVCRKCERWNLTPLEERWEAIEQCERAFSSTRLRASTDNIGMARLSEGLELVRIGQPQRPEFAAWRYGDQFGRRRRRYLAFAAAGSSLAVGSFISGPVLGLSIASAISMLNMATSFTHLYQANRVQARVQVPGKDRPAVIRRASMSKAAIVRDGEEGWHLRLRYDRGILIDREIDRQVTIAGEAAMRAAATIMAVANHEGANKQELRDAVSVIEKTPDPHRLFLNATTLGNTARRARKSFRVDDESRIDAPGEVSLANLTKEMRFALEIAANEDVERRAMEGELAMLEAAWRQAEEIAAIADELTVPPSVEAEHRKLSGDRSRSDED